MKKPFATYHIGSELCSLYWSPLSETTREEPGRLVVTDSHVASLYKLKRGDVLILPPGENHKNWDSVTKIVRKAFERNLDRTSTLVGAGGGVIGDMTAFAASLYMRGTGLLLHPTTLLSMVDASLGGKTGIDFDSFKNSIGTFYPATEIHIDPTVVSTLPDREYLCGLAEVIKSAMIGDADLLLLLENRRERILSREPGLVRELIERSLTVKGKIVEEDFTEKGVRAWLNLGHTFGHALETVTGFKISHGEAVAWGIGRALTLGVKLGITDTAYRKRIRDLLTAYGYSLEIPIPGIVEYTAAFMKDKKKAGSAVRFIIPEETGSIRIEKVPVDDLMTGILLHQSE
jgi:3-dehydroquinate synthase